MADAPAPAPARQRVLSLTPIQIGSVGVVPQQWNLSTDLTNTELQTIDLLTSTNPRPAPGDFVFAKASDGSRYYVVDGATLVEQGGGSSNFNYDETWFVATNGNDLNDGKSINTPKATLNGAQADFTSLSNVINILDAGTYTDVSFFHENGEGNRYTTINAPAAVFAAANPFGIPLFNVQSGELFINCRQIINGVTNSAAIYQSGGVVSVRAHRINSNGGFPMYYGTAGLAYLDGDFIGGNAEFSNTVRITARYLSGFWITNIGVDNGQLFAGAAESDASISGTGTYRGQFGDTFYGTVVP